MSHERPKRSSAPTESTRLQVQLTIPAPVRRIVSRCWIMHVSTWSLLRHVLYSRGLVPTPVDQIMDVSTSSSSCETKKRASPMERKILQCGASMATILQDLKVIFDPELALQVNSIVLLVGPSWSRTKEYYEIRFPHLGEDDIIGDAVVDENDDPRKAVAREHVLSRRLIRAFLEATHDPEDGEARSDFLMNPPPGAASYQVHVMIQVSADTAKKLFENSRYEQAEEAEGVDRLSNKWKQLSQRLVVRQNFSLQAKQPTSSNNPKIPHVKVSVSTQMDSIPDIGYEKAEMRDDDAVWMSLRSHVKGFRP